MSDLEKTLNRLRAMELPTSLAKLVKENGKIDPIRNSFDLYFATKAVQEDFSELSVLHPLIGMIITATEAMQQLDSTPKVKDYILNELVTEQERFSLADRRLSYPGSSMRALREAIIKMAAFEDIESAQREKIHELVGYWDQAALEIITDQALFHTKTKTGNEGRLSEYLGTSVLFNLHPRRSPLAKDGRYLPPVLQAVRYKDIVEGRITLNDKLTHQHQKELLLLLSHLEGPQRQLGQDYWREIEKNPDFIAASYFTAVRYGFDNRNDLLCKLLAHEWERAKVSEIKYSWEIRTIGLIGTQFEGRTIYDRFKARNQQEIDTFFGQGKELHNYGIKRAKDEEVIEDTIVMLLDYEKRNDKVEIELAIVNPRRYEEKRIVFQPGENATLGLEAELEPAVFRLVDGFEQFLALYQEKLAEQKNKLSRSESTRN